MAVIIDIIAAGSNNILIEPVNSDIAQSITVENIMASPAVVTVSTGPPGPPGVKNVYVQSTPPANPQEGWVWIDIS